MISDYVKKAEIWYESNFNSNKSKGINSKNKIVERYWKLSASERLHHDSLIDRIPNFDILGATFAYIKLCVFIPAFFILAGYIKGVPEKIIPLARDILTLMFGLLKPAIIFFILCVFITAINENIQTKKIQKRFRIRK